MNRGPMWLRYERDEVAYYDMFNLLELGLFMSYG